MASTTAREGSSGVEKTLAVARSEPSPSSTTRSVKVPPHSTPIRMRPP